VPVSSQRLTAFLCFQTADDIFLALAADNQKPIAMNNGERIKMVFRNAPHILLPNIEVLRSLVTEA